MQAGGRAAAALWRHGVSGGRSVSGQQERLQGYIRRHLSIQSILYGSACEQSAQVGARGTCVCGRSSGAFCRTMPAARSSAVPRIPYLAKPPGARSCL